MGLKIPKIEAEATQEISLAIKVPVKGVEVKDDMQPNKIGILTFQVMNNKYQMNIKIRGQGSLRK